MWHSTEFVSPVSQLHEEAVVKPKPKVKVSTYLPIATDHENFPKLDLFSFQVYVDPNKSFNVNLPNITPDLLSLKKREDCLRLIRKPLTFYQNQFNMAIWCATTGCGISVNDHLNSKLPMIRSLYHFHVYYQIRKIFKTLQIPLPGETAFNNLNNNMNVRKYRDLLSKFGLKDEYDFSVFVNNDGWESWSVPDYDPNITDPGCYINNSKITYFLMQVHEDKVPPMFQADFDNGMVNFKYPDTFIKSHVKRHKNIITSVNQKECLTFQQFMMLDSQGLSTVGIEMLNDSIRTYVYCLLGSQAETRFPIVGKSGTELDAQRQFLKLLEDSAKKHPDIPTSIARYQKALSDTHKRLNYVIGPGLYIIPSDMILKMGTIENYNNNIVIATVSMKPGANEINNTKNIPTALMEGPGVKTYRTKANTETIKPEKPKIKPPEVHQPVAHQPVAHHPVASSQDTTDHENMKFILYGATGILVTLALYLR